MAKWHGITMVIQVDDYIPPGVQVLAGVNYRANDRMLADMSAMTPVFPSAQWRLKLTEDHSEKGRG